MGAIVDLFVKLRELWKHAGQVAQLAAIVTIVSSCLTFLTAFVNRKSNRLVARDTRQREFRLLLLQPLIQDADAVFLKLNRMRSALWRLSNLQQQEERTVQSDLDKRAALERDIKQAKNDFWAELVHFDGGPLFNSELLSHRLPLIKQSADAIHDLIADLAHRSATDVPSAVAWLNANTDQHRHLFLSFHRAVDHVLFGTHPIWAAVVRTRRYVRRVAEVAVGGTYGRFRRWLRVRQAHRNFQKALDDRYQQVARDQSRTRDQ